MDSVLQLTPLIQFFLIFSVFGLLGFLGPALVSQKARGLAQKEHHDVLGIMFSVAAAFYGVVLAFVIVAAWQNFQEAEEREQAESLALFELYVVSTKLPQPVGQPMIQAIHSYITDTLTYEWSNKPQIEAGRRELSQIFNDMLTLDPQTQKQGILFGKAFEQIAKLFEARQQRILYSQNNIPGIVWTVIVFGAAVTITLSFFFFSQHRLLQAVISMLFAMLVGLTIIAIYDLSHPYQGFSRIAPTGFKELLHEIDSRASAPTFPAGAGNAPPVATPPH